MIWVEIILFYLGCCVYKGNNGRKGWVAGHYWGWQDGKYGVHFGYACFGFYQLGLAGANQVYGCPATGVFLQRPVLQKSAEVGGGARWLPAK
jgi:hypothetical protein